jgi:hypothetical protein
MRSATVIPLPTSRRGIRFPVEAAAAFWWTDAQGVVQQGEGHTRDVSEHGVFVVSDVCPPLGIRVRLHFCLDPNTKHSLGIDIDGHVLRVDKVSGRHAFCGFAILHDEAKLGS